MGTHWLGEDFLRPLPERVHRQPPLPRWPDFPDFHLEIPFGGVLYRDVPKIRELLTAEESRVRPGLAR